MKNFKFTINGNVYEVGVEAAENGKSNVTVNGKSYVVEVEADVMQATTVRRPLSTPSAAAAKGTSGVMKSPLPGFCGLQFCSCSLITEKLNTRERKYPDENRTD